MHPLFLIALVLVAAVVWVSGILLTLVRLSRVQHDNTDDSAPVRMDAVLSLKGGGDMAWLDEARPARGRDDSCCLREGAGTAFLRGEI